MRSWEAREWGALPSYDAGLICQDPFRLWQADSPRVVGMREDASPAPALILFSPFVRGVIFAGTAPLCRSQSTVICMVRGPFLTPK